MLLISIIKPVIMPSSWFLTAKHMYNNISDEEFYQHVLQTLDIDGYSTDDIQPEFGWVIEQKLGGKNPFDVASELEDAYQDGLSDFLNSAQYGQ